MAAHSRSDVIMVVGVPSRPVAAEIVDRPEATCGAPFSMLGGGSAAMVDTL